MYMLNYNKLNLNVHFQPESMKKMRTVDFFTLMSHSVPGSYGLKFTQTTEFSVSLVFTISINNALLAVRRQH